jgi:hypothetical protein
MKLTSWIPAAVLSVLLCSSSAFAQSGMGMAFSRDILVGPFATAGVAMNAGSLDTGTTSSPGLAFAIGGVGYVPISEDMALVLGLAYDSRSLSTEQTFGSTKITVDQNISYFSIRPGFKFKAFEVGLGLGLPLSISAKLDGQNFEGLSTDSLAFLVELRAGFGFPILKNDASELRLLVQGSYGLTKMSKSSNSDTKGDGPLATAEVGLSYLFDISHSDKY